MILYYYTFIKKKNMYITGDVRDSFCHNEKNLKHTRQDAYLAEQPVFFKSFN